MNRDAAYHAAKYKVKIHHLTERGYDINGIVHVGANDGYEMQWYKQMGIKHLIGVEPLPKAIALFKAHYPDIPLIECALSDHDGTAKLIVSAGDGQGSSLLEECRPNPDYVTDEVIDVEVHRWDSLGIPIINYDCLVMDVQGHELEALHGFGDYLQQFRVLNIECSRVPVYKGGATAYEVEDYLASQGFRRISPIVDHDDVFFVYNDAKPDVQMPIMLNLGSGQRPFSPPFVNIDIQERWYPDIVHDCSTLPMFENESVEIVVLHHVLEHLGCGEGIGMIREAYRVLKPGGSLLVFVPDMRGLCQRWLMRQIDTQLFMTNVYGAYMGDEADRHRWGFDAESLSEHLKANASWSKVKMFDWRRFPGANIVGPEFWILGMEAVK